MSGRCPECGAAPGRGLNVVVIPWEQRRDIGHARAYLRTLRLTSLGARRMAGAVAAPVSYADAQRFRCVTSALVALPIVAALVAAMAVAGDARFLGAVDETFGGLVLNPFPGAPVRPWVLWNLLVPYSAGATLPPVMPVAVVLAVFVVTGVASYGFHPASIPVAVQNRAVAMSHYACAPLFLLPVSMLMVALAIAADVQARTARDSSPMKGAAIVLGITGGLGAALGIVLFWNSTLQLLRYTTRANAWRTLAAAVVLPMLWVACGAIILCGLPWAVGLIWLIIDSLR